MGMLLSLMVMVVVVAHPGNGCPAGFVRAGDLCVKTKGKREALDAPMPHKTKRGSKDETSKPCSDEDEISHQAMQKRRPAVRAAQQWAPRIKHYPGADCEECFDKCIIDSWSFCLDYCQSQPGC